MLYKVRGDILKTRAQVIVQGVSANDPMDQGLAKSLHDLFPEMHKAFHRWCHQHHPKPGAAWHWQTPLPDKVIVNLVTREGGYGHGARPGRAKLKHVNHSLHALRKMIADEGFGSVALPRLASGIGGLDWAEVWSLMENQLGELQIPIYVYTVFRPGERAEEADS